jgi:hypothetical protein
MKSAATELSAMDGGFGRLGRRQGKRKLTVAKQG